MTVQSKNSETQQNKSPTAFQAIAYIVALAIAIVVIFGLGAVLYPSEATGWIATGLLALVAVGLGYAILGKGGEHDGTAVR